MSYWIILCILFAAAVLEAGGDALLRAGLHQVPGLARASCLTGGAGALFLYGLVVNAPAWDFGRLLGVYVSFFFVVAQMISWLGFGQKPSLGTLVGGAFIVLGGYIVSRG